MPSRKKITDVIDNTLFDDRWTGEVPAFIVDGVIYDIDLHAEKGVKRRVLPNDRTLALSDCLKERAEGLDGDVVIERSKSSQASCFEDPFKFISRQGLDFTKIVYVDRLVEDNSDKPNDVKSKIKSQILKKYYGVNWNYGGN